MKTQLLILACSSFILFGCNKNTASQNAKDSTETSQTASETKTIDPDRQQLMDELAEYKDNPDIPPVQEKLARAYYQMLKTGGGTIVNLASIAGLNGLYATAQYNASKHAVVGLTKGASIDYAQQGIRVNAVAPGAIKTDILKNAIASGTYDVSSIEAIHPMNRLGEVEDIAKAIYFLASDENTFMTGTILNIDGGYNAK